MGQESRWRSPDADKHLVEGKEDAWFWIHEPSGDESRRFQAAIYKIDEGDEPLVHLLVRRDSKEEIEWTRDFLTEWAERDGSRLHILYESRPSRDGTFMRTSPKVELVPVIAESIEHTFNYIETGNKKPDGAMVPDRFDIRFPCKVL